MNRKFKVVLLHMLDRKGKPTKVSPCGIFFSMSAAIRRARQLLDRGVPSSMIDIHYQYDGAWFPLFEADPDHFDKL